LKVEKFIRPWKGYAFRHIPDGNDVLDFSLCGLSNENRWNLPGEPTLYLAGSKQVALGEYSRHYQENRTHKLTTKIQSRSFWRLKVQLKRTIDLCNPNVYSTFPGAPGCFKEIKSARTVASVFRNVFKIEAIFVPSMVFLDDLSKWCLILFLDNLPKDVNQYIPDAKKNGLFEIVSPVI
jgi:hypothetical protein